MKDADEWREGLRMASPPNPEALAQELSGELAEAIAAIEEPYRAVLVLRVRHGLPAADVAHALGATTAAHREHSLDLCDHLAAMLTRFGAR